MKKIIKEMVMCGAIFLLPACTNSSINLNPGSKVNANSLKTSYKLYEKINIPTHTFEEEGTSVTVKGTIVTPSNKAYQVSSYSLNEIGKYYVKYSALINNNEYSYEESFTVLKPLFEYSNIENSSVSTRIPSYAAKYTSASGLYVNLAKGDTLKVNQPINMETGEELEKIVTGFATPLKQGVFDFSNLNFVLTDVNNPDVYLTVIVNGQPNAATYAEYSYWRAGGQNQISTGKYTRSNGTVQYQTSGILGNLCLLPFHAAINNGSLDPRPIDPADYQFYFAYDSKDIAIYTDSVYKNVYPDSVKTADLDNPTYFSRIWSGFPSGKAYLSISGGKFQSNAARFCITSILGVDITKDTIEDTSGPEITIDERFNENLPEGKLLEPYSIPEASAYDEYESSFYDVETRVVYNYQTSNEINVDINDNKFTPKQNGNYAIIYKATDSFGNVSTKVMGVHVGNEIAPISFDMPNNKMTIKGGESIELNNPTNISGGVGIYETEIEITNPNGVKTILENNIYEPTLVGEYQYSYKVKDYVGNELIKSSSFAVTDNEDPVLVSVSDLNESYLTTFDNKLPKVKVNVVNDGVVKKAVCDVEITDAAGTKLYTPQNETCVFTASDEVKNATIRFLYNNKVVKTSVVNLVSATNASGKISLANYFIGENIDAHSAIYQSLRGIEVNNTAELSHYRFYNKLVAGDFEYDLDRVNPTYGFTNLDIKLVDSLNSNISLTLHFSDHNTFRIGDSDFEYALNTDKRTDISIGFKDTMLYINSSPIELSYFDNNIPFTLFPSGYVYLDVTATGSSSSYVVTRVSNFSTYKTSDDVLPDHAMEGDFGGSYALGTTYHIYKMFVADVIKPYSEATLTVTINGKNPLSTTGIVLKDVAADSDYDINLNEYGEYRFTYSFKGEKKTYSYSIYATDAVDPTIDFTSMVPTAVKLNAEIKIPTFKVSDDYSETENIRIIVSVVNPTGYEEYLTYTLFDDVEYEYHVVGADKSSIVAHYKGTYTFKIIAIDEAGNSTIKMFDVSVY